MLQLTPQSRIFLAVQPVDFRKGIDGLAALCRQTLHENPLGGTVYVFRNRTGTTLKLLAHDGQGFWLCTKRLSQGHFHWWPAALTPSVTLSAWELNVPLESVLKMEQITLGDGNSPPTRIPNRFE